MNCFMKKFSLILLLGWGSVAALPAAPAPIYRNTGTTVYSNVPPQIDAVIFENTGQFSINSLLQLPYDFRNTLFFTNASRGLISSPSGIRFDHVDDGGIRSPAASFFNDQGAEVDVSGRSLQNLFGNLLSVTFPLLEISATNVVNHGLLRTRAEGLIRIRGKNVDLGRGGFQVEPLISGGGGGFCFIGHPGATPTNFVPDIAITDLYWHLTNAIVQVNNNFNLRTNRDGTVSVRTPPHQVIRPSGVPRGRCYDTNSTLLSLANARAYSRFEAVTPTNWIVQAAFVANTEPSIVHAVRFYPSTILTNPFNTIAVQLTGSETNVVFGGQNNNYLYVIDYLASETNYVLLTNLNSDVTCPTFMPAPLQITRREPCEFTLGEPAGPLLTNDIFYMPSYSNTVVTNFYAAYSVNANYLPDTPALQAGSVTNLPGRVEIDADNLDLTRTRLRGNGIVNISTRHLIGSSNAIMDVPRLNFDLGATNGLLSVRSLAKPSVERFFGQVNAFSMIWTNLTGFTETNEVEEPPGSGMLTNVVTTNVVEIGFHVLFVDGRLQRNAQVSVHNLALRSTNVVVSDDMLLTGSLLVEGQSFTLDGGLRMSASGDMVDWTAQTAPTLRRFTNNGNLNIPNIGRFGSDLAVPYEAFVNRRMIQAFSFSIQAEEFENTGTLRTQSGFAGGDIVVTTRSGKMESGGEGFVALGNVVLAAHDLKFRGYQIDAGNALFLTVTNTLTDTGGDAGNTWRVENGFHLLRKPRAGDLLGTTIQSRAPRFLIVRHTWAAEDRGPTRAGFRDNAALGRLNLVSEFDAVHSFAGVGERNALYVDFLSLDTNILADLEGRLEVAPNFTLYFADANAPVEELDGRLNGRLRWVRDFAGPNSGVDVALDDGRVIQVNRQLRDSNTIDSDADGIVNFLDLTPFGGVTLSDVRVLAQPFKVQITWEAAAQTTYEVQYTRDLNSPITWRHLLDYTNSAALNGPVTVEDSPPPGELGRFYRVLYSP